jgi:hypothetical protein
MGLAGMADALRGNVGLWNQVSSRRRSHGDPQNVSMWHDRLNPPHELTSADHGAAYALCQVTGITIHT